MMPIAFSTVWTSVIWTQYSLHCLLEQVYLLEYMSQLDNICKCSNGCSNVNSPSVAMVVTDIFQKNWIMMSVKFVRIFVRIEHIKNWGVIYWPKRIRLLYSVGNTGLILSGQYMTPQFVMCSILTDILMNLAILLTS